MFCLCRGSRGNASLSRYSKPRRIERCGGALLEQIIMRLEFTSKTKRQAFARSNGLCECALIPWLNRPEGCGQRLTDGVRYEHILPAELGGDNSLENAAALTIQCWKEKTAKYDLPTIAKSNRVRDRARGIRRRSSKPMLGSRASPWKKRMDGTVVRR